MPWQHCGTTINDDIRSCPECGGGKQTWTTKLDKTRMFVLSTGEHDPAQAETLEVAQESGSPFCEDCQAADNPPEEPEEEEPSDPDTEAQAQVLEDAADSGAPFCEECQKADNEDATAEAAV